MLNDKRILAGEEYLKQLNESERGFQHETYFPQKLPNFRAGDSALEVLAYYLPQFHPFPENDEWWGKGFTEWTNVTKARPHFKGHYQPHLPADLGFYDLRNDETMRQQIELAKAYGLSGFIFYYYWFDGRRVLEKPLDLFMKRKDFDFKFSLCWANENWTRRWDGAEHEVLLGQTHSSESDENFIRDVIQYMEDPRYIEIDGRPMLTVYRVGLLPELEKTATRWREIAKSILGKDLYLVYAMTFGESRNPKDFGFDAGVQFPPHGISVEQVNYKLTPFTERYAGNAYDYEAIASSARSLLKSFDFPVIPTVFPSWDNTARRGENAHLYVGSSPDNYAAWLAEAAHHAIEKPVAHNRSVVVVNAWNEWAEGAHLEPDQRNGHAFLRTTSDILRPYLRKTSSSLEMPSLEPTAIVQSPVNRAGGRTAFIIHAYYAEALKELVSSIPESCHHDIFITLSNEPDPEILATISTYAKNVTLLFYPNRGRDIRPFMGALRFAKAKGYAYFIKLHTKKSLHRSDGDIWNSELTAPFLTDRSKLQIESFLDDNSNISLIGPAGHILDGATFMGSANNLAWLRQLSKRLGVFFEYKGFQFIAGSMFAGRICDLMSLSDDGWIASMFEDEMGRRDGTLAHAMERMFGLHCYQQGHGIAQIDSDGVVTRQTAHSGSYQFAQTQAWSD